MKHSSRFLWGLVAGLAVVLVKVLGTDIEHVESLFLIGTAGAIGFYLFTSIITVLLGGISAFFSKDKEPSRILVFCASFPALVSTAIAPERAPVGTTGENVARLNEQVETSRLGISLISAAHAQDQSVNKHGVCDEGSFGGQFVDAAKQYFGKPDDQPIFSIVVASKTDFEEAKAVANTIGANLQGETVSVGCRRPGNPNYPVIVGNMTTRDQARTELGALLGNDSVPDDSYISAYQYRKPIYTAP